MNCHGDEEASELNSGARGHFHMPPPRPRDPRSKYKYNVLSGPAEPVGPVGPWPDQNFDKDSSRMRNQFDNWPP